MMIHTSPPICVGDAGREPVGSYVAKRDSSVDDVIARGRVTINHCGALSSYASSHAGRVIGLMKRANVNFVMCPKEEMIISGMGPSRVKEMHAAGVNCAYGHNNMADMFSPYGRMDMLEIGGRIPLVGPAAMRVGVGCWSAISERTRRVFASPGRSGDGRCCTPCASRRQGLGLRAGCRRC